MNDKELFEEVLERVADWHKIEVKRPYGDCYVELVDRNGNNLGGFNYSGHNLSYNICRLGTLLGENASELYR